MRTILAATLVQVLPRLSSDLRQVPDPGQHVEVTQLNPSPHCVELVHVSPQFIPASSIHTFLPSVVCSQMQLPLFPPPQGTPAEQPITDGLRQPGAVSRGGGEAIVVDVNVVVVVVVLVMTFVAVAVLVA
jgi:hypothetical protein